ncbi:MAG: hypothetical protein ABL996_26025, partial [Micropepsaceae bacterium]
HLAYANQLAFTSAIAPYVAAHQHEEAWADTEFRLNSASVYPLANVAIAAVHSEGRSPFNSTKWGLSIVTAMAALAVLLIGHRSSFGFWSAVLLLNLIAFHVVPASAVVGQVPGNMHPFLSYVPRGAAAVAIAAVPLAFAARRWGAFLASAGLLVLCHVALGGLLVLLIALAVLVCALIERFRLLDMGLFYAVFAVGALQGPSGLLQTASVGCLAYVYSRLDSSLKTRAEGRLLLFGSQLLFLIVTLSVATRLPWLNNLLEPLTGVSYAYEIPDRLSGGAYSLFVLTLLAAGRAGCAHMFCLGAPPVSTPQPSHARILNGLAIVLTALIGTAHYDVYANALQKNGPFFGDACSRSPVSVPSGLMSLPLSKAHEATVFLSFGDHLFRIGK